MIVEFGTIHNYSSLDEILKLLCAVLLTYTKKNWALCKYDIHEYSGVPWDSGARGKKWNQRPFSCSFFPQKKKSKTVDPKLISVIFKVKRKKSTFSQSLKGLHGFTLPGPTSLQAHKIIP